MGILGGAWYCPGMEPRVVSATHFKAHCLALMDEVAQTGQRLIVTKNKRHVVRVVPAAERWSLVGSVRQLVSDDELIAPVDIQWDLTR
jgi:prevent-host-death family protein